MFGRDPPALPSSEGAPNTSSARETDVPLGYHEIEVSYGKKEKTEDEEEKDVP